MAVRSEELIYQRDAVVYRFPAVARRRAAERAMLRRRAALASIGLLVVIAGLFATGSEGTAPAAGAKGPSAVVLHQGETLWDLAARHAPAGMDVRSYIDAILERNGLTTLPEPGTRLRLP
jgi:Tfp pilus assembly protein FimV